MLYLYTECSSLNENHCNHDARAHTLANERWFAEPCLPELRLMRRDVSVAFLLHH